MSDSFNNNIEDENGYSNKTKAYPYKNQNNSDSEFSESSTKKRKNQKNQMSTAIETHKKGIRNNLKSSNVNILNDKDDIINENIILNNDLIDDSQFEMTNEEIDSLFHDSSLKNLEYETFNSLPFPCNILIPHKDLNPIQSKLFPIIFNTNTDNPYNLIISSPTGSGKTTLFEISICDLYNRINSKSPSSSSLNFKAIYIAPIKSLCQEKYLDWKSRFARLSLKVIEVTGDSENINYTQINEANIILSTPERWECVSRRWKEYSSLIGNIGLLMIDEIHLLQDNERGSTLECLITRMKLFTEMRIFHNSIIYNLRIIGLSASFPNIKDVCSWLKTTRINSEMHCFGEEFRPVQIEKHVLGFKNNNKNMFLFEKYLNFRLIDVITRFSEGKPSLVFCQTQKGTIEAAKQIALDRKDVVLNSNSDGFSLKNEFQVRPSFKIKDRQLAELVDLKIGFHNAGLSIEDRRNVEDYFKTGVIDIICTTSTLAQGVNLPARLVIIKSTYCYRGPKVGFTEYSQIEIDQMIGRAGRPQYDNKGVSVIMTEEGSVNKYNSSNEYNFQIESKLKTKMIEYINHEIVMNTIQNMEMGVLWLRNTFWFIRLTSLDQKVSRDTGNIKENTMISRIRSELLSFDYSLLLSKTIQIFEKSKCDLNCLCLNEEYSQILQKLTISIGNIRQEDVISTYLKLIIKKTFHQLEEFELIHISYPSFKDYDINVDGLSKATINSYIIDFLLGIGLFSKFDPIVSSTKLGKEMSDSFVQFETIKIITTFIYKGLPYKNKENQSEVSSFSKVKSSVYLNSISPISNSDSSSIIEDKLLSLIGYSKELEDFRSKIEERKYLNELNKSVRYKVKTAIDSYFKKSFVLLQSGLENLTIENWELKRQQTQILQVYIRVLSIMKEVYLLYKDGKCFLLCLLLIKGILQSQWPDSYLIYKQLPKIGEKLAKALYKSGLHSISNLIDANPRKIETVCGKNTPFGSQIIEAACGISKVKAINIRFSSLNYTKDSSKGTIFIKVSSPKAVHDFDSYSKYGIVLLNKENEVMYYKVISPYIYKKRDLGNVNFGISNYVPDQEFSFNILNIKNSDFPISLFALNMKFIGFDSVIVYKNIHDKPVLEEISGCCFKYMNTNSNMTSNMTSNSRLDKTKQTICFEDQRKSVVEERVFHENEKENDEKEKTKAKQKKKNKKNLTTSLTSQMIIDDYMEVKQSNKKEKEIDINNDENEKTAFKTNQKHEKKTQINENSYIKKVNFNYDTYLNKVNHGHTNETNTFHINSDDEENEKNENKIFISKIFEL